VTALLVGNTFGNTYRTLGLDERRGRWVVEQEFHTNVWVQRFMVYGCKDVFCLGPGSRKTVIHVRYNGAIVEHPVDGWKPSRILPKDYTYNVIFLHANLLTSNLRFYVPLHKKITFKI